jgi:ABC-type nitrate/sulfonate/bicarbonate transport system permease component
LYKREWKWNGGFALNKKDNSKYLIISLLSLATGIVIWWLLTDVFPVTKSTMLPSPVKVAKTFIVKMYDKNPDGATLPQHLIASLQVALSGYSIGVIIGVPLGIAMAWYKNVDRFARPLFDLLRPIPGIAWIPLIIIFFGIGLMSKAMVIFLSAFIACVVNSYSGIKQTRDVHLWVGQTFGASNFQLLLRIAVPTSLPYVFTGLRVGLGASWGALVAAELLASTRGLGFMIQQNRGLFRTDVIIAGMISIGAVGALLASIISWVERKVLKEGKW